MIMIRNEPSIRSLLQDRGVGFFVTKDHRHLGVPLVRVPEALQRLLTEEVRKIPGFEDNNVLMFHSDAQMHVQFSRPDWSAEVLEAVVNDEGVRWLRYPNGSPVPVRAEPDDSRLARVVELAQDLSDAQASQTDERVVPPNMPEDLLARARLSAGFYQRMVSGRRLVVVSDIGGVAPTDREGRPVGAVQESVLGPVVRFFRSNAALITAHPTGQILLRCWQVRAVRGPDGLNRLQHEPMGELWTGQVEHMPRHLERFERAARAAVKAARQALKDGPPVQQVLWGGAEQQELEDPT